MDRAELGTQKLALEQRLKQLEEQGARLKRAEFLETLASWARCFRVCAAIVLGAGTAAAAAVANPQTATSVWPAIAALVAKRVVEELVAKKKNWIDAM